MKARGITLLIVWLAAMAALAGNHLIVRIGVGDETFKNFMSDLHSHLNGDIFFIWPGPAGFRLVFSLVAKLVKNGDSRFLKPVDELRPLPGGKRRWDYLTFIRNEPPKARTYSQHPNPSKAGLRS